MGASRESSASGRRGKSSSASPSPGDEGGENFSARREDGWHRLMAGLTDRRLLLRVRRLQGSRFALAGTFGILAVVEMLLGVRQVAIGWQQDALPWLELVIGGNAVIVGVLALGLLWRERLGRHLLRRSRTLANRRLAFLDRFTQQLRAALQEAPDDLAELEEIAPFLLRSLDRFLLFSWAGLWRLEDGHLRPLAVHAPRLKTDAPALQEAVPIPTVLDALKDRQTLTLLGEDVHRLVEAGFPVSRQIFACAIHRDGALDGVLVVARRRGRPPFDEAEKAFLSAVARSLMLGIQAGQIARLRLELQDALRRMERAQRVQAEFLSELSHELRTPLNAIIGFGELLTAGKPVDREKEREYLHHIVGAARSLLAMLEELLTISDRPDLGVPEDVIAVDPVAVALGTVARMRATAARHEVSFTVEGEADGSRDGSGRRIHADPRWLRQAVLAAGFWAITAAGAKGAVTFHLDGERGGARLTFLIRPGPARRPDELLAEGVEEGGEEGSYIARGRRLTSPLNFARALVEAQGGRTELVRADQERVALTLILSETMALHDS